MTIANETVKIIVLGTGAQTVFNYNFLIPTPLQCTLIYTDASGLQLELPPSTYTVSGTGNVGGGTFTYPLTGAPIAAGTTLTLVREVPYKQLTNFTNQGGYYPQTVEQSLDTLEMQIQQLAEEASRALAYNVVDVGPFGTLPPAIQRAQTVLAFDTQGQPFSLPYNQFFHYSGEPEADAISVTTFGAKCDNATDDTAAWHLAVASGRCITMPAGRSLCAPIVFTAVNSFKLRGVAPYASVVVMTGPGTGWTFTNAQNCILEDVAFQPSVAYAATTSGVEFSGASGVCEVSRCQFTVFGAQGLRLVGTNSVQLSGHSVHDCLFLSCLGHGLFSQYSNDFKITDNQFGIVAGSAPPGYGCQLDYSSAGTYSGNFHWENTVGFYASNSNYLRITAGNRFEQSKTNNVVMDGGSYNLFSDNHIHSASNDGTTTKDSAVFQNQNYISIVDNQTYSFSNYHNYSMVIQPGCNNVTLRANQADFWTVAPIFIDPSLAGSVFNCDDTAAFHSTGTVPANSTTFIGVGGSDAVEANVCGEFARRCSIVRMHAAIVSGLGGGTATYTIMLNGVAATATQGVIGPSTGQFDVLILESLIVQPNDTVSVRIVTSAGATAVAHRVTLSMVEY